VLIGTNNAVASVAGAKGGAEACPVWVAEKSGLLLVFTE
jgi:hypothetical protein